MSIGHVVRVRTGKQNSDQLYVQLKNGAVYKYIVPLTVGGLIQLQTLIRENRGRIRLKYWIRVKDREGNLVPS